MGLIGSKWEENCQFPKGRGREVPRSVVGALRQLDQLSRAFHAKDSHFLMRLQTYSMLVHTWNLQQQLGRLWLRETRNAWRKRRGEQERCWVNPSPRVRGKIWKSWELLRWRRDTIRTKRTRFCMGLKSDEKHGLLRGVMVRGWRDSQPTPGTLTHR